MIPLCFSTNTAQRQGYLELYFAPKADKVDKNLPAALRNDWPKADQLYRKHHIYGDHQYLVPVRNGWPLNVEFLPSGLTSNIPMVFQQFGNEPTTAVHHQKLQLMPCSQFNLGLIRELQSEPFYIEIGKKSYVLNIWNEGRYWSIPGQRPAPRCWFGPTNHPVITLATNTWPKHFSNLQDIPWPAIAQQLGSPSAPLWGNTPLLSKYTQNDGN